MKSKLPLEHSFFVPQAQLNNIKRCILAVSSNYLINWDITPGDIPETYNVTVYYNDLSALRIMGLYCGFLDIHGSAQKQKDELLAINPAEAPMCFPESLSAKGDGIIPLKRCIVFMCKNEVSKPGFAFCDEHR